MKPDYGPTVVMVVGVFALVAIVVAYWLLPLLAHIGERIQAIGA